MRVLLVAVSMTSLVLAGCMGGSTESSTTGGPTGTSSTPPMDHSPKTYNIAMSGNAFSNTTLNIHTGDTVIWTHNDGPTVAHTVTNDAGEAFDSHPDCGAVPVGVPVPGVCMTQGESFPRKFERAGTNAIHCKIHSAMTMSITVMAHDMNMTAPPA